MNEAAQDITRDERAGGGRTDGPTWKPTHTYYNDVVMVLDRVDEDGDPLCEHEDGMRMYYRRSALTLIPPPNPEVVRGDVYQMSRQFPTKNGIAIPGYEPVGEPVEAGRIGSIETRQGDYAQIFRPVKGGGK